MNNDSYVYSNIHIDPKLRQGLAILSKRMYAERTKNIISTPIEVKCVRCKEHVDKSTAMKISCNTIRNGKPIVMYRYYCPICKLYYKKNGRD